MSERFVKLNDTVYYESTLRMLNEEQLKELIERCQAGIEETKKKLESFRNENYDENDIEHYEAVVKKFNSAIVYLESDIVLLEQIKRDKEFFAVPENDNNNEWYREFFNQASASLFGHTFKKLVANTSITAGFTPKEVSDGKNVKF